MAKIYDGMHFFRKGVKSKMAKISPEERAYEVLTNREFASWPVNPISIAEQEGIQVLQAPFPDNVDGVISKRSDTVIIYVNQSSPLNRKRFTIAHELGHFFLHLQDTDGNFLDNDMSLFRSNAHILSPTELSKEREANEFAAALLMPHEAVELEWLFADSLEDVAKAFGVSKQALTIRLKNLRLL